MKQSPIDPAQTSQSCEILQKFLKSVIRHFGIFYINSTNDADFNRGTLLSNFGRFCDFIKIFVNNFFKRIAVALDLHFKSYRSIGNQRHTFRLYLPHKAFVWLERA